MSGAEETCRELIETLRQEAALYRELAELLEGDRGALRTFSLRELEASNGKKALLAGRLATLEGRRQEQAGRLARAAGLPEGGTTLRALAARAPGSLGGTLEAVRAELAAVCGRVGELHVHNALFLEHSLRLVAGTLSVIKGCLERPAVYGAKGRVPEPRLSGRVLSCAG